MKAYIAGACACVLLGIAVDELVARRRQRSNIQERNLISVEELGTRVSDLERQLQAKDNELQRLKSSETSLTGGASSSTELESLKNEILKYQQNEAKFLEELARFQELNETSKASQLSVQTAAERTAHLEQENSVLFGELAAGKKYSEELARRCRELEMAIALLETSQKHGDIGKMTMSSVRSHHDTEATSFKNKLREGDEEHRHRHADGYDKSAEEAEERMSDAASVAATAGTTEADFEQLSEQQNLDMVPMMGSDGRGQKDGGEVMEGDKKMEEGHSSQPPIPVVEEPAEVMMPNDENNTGNDALEDDEEAAGIEEEGGGPSHVNGKAGTSSSDGQTSSSAARKKKRKPSKGRRV